MKDSMNHSAFDRRWVRSLGVWKDLGGNTGKREHCLCGGGFLGAIGSQGIREMQKVTKRARELVANSIEVSQTHTDARP